MIRLNIPWLVEIVLALDSLDRVSAGKNFEDVWFWIFDARNQVNLVYEQSVYRQHIRVSRPQANEFDVFLTQLLARDTKEAVSEMDQWSIRNRRDRFKEVFLAEFSAMPTYLVTRKESYDIESLIDAGMTLFPPSLGSKVPEASRDTIEAGKALAFEVATACGFHTFRVVEAVTRRYWDEVSSKKARPKPETLGRFAAELEKSKFGDERVVESIKQITRLHRNPIAHPEVILTVEEAIGVLGMARSVVGAMLSALPELPPTTGAPSTVQSPV